MSKPKILVARAIFLDIIDQLRTKFEVEVNEYDDIWTQDELILHLQGKQGALITSSEKIDAKLLQACPELRAVCTLAVGYNNIDVAACTAQGVLVTNAPNVLTETTADLGFALMMATARRIGESERFLREGLWRQWDIGFFAGQDIHGATLGILGMGRIGQAIAKRGAHGFGMPVIYHNRSRLAPETEQQLNARYVSKEELLQQSDHLIITVPYSPEVHHFIGQRELARMKPTATLTNIARGGIIDEVALVEALRTHQIAAAGLDVFEGEPHVDPDLLSVPNIVLTPHIGSASLKTRHAMANLAAQNLLSSLDLNSMPKPLTALNPEVLSTKRN
ncbi:2-hydroxyacid dehydrogenase [Aquirhabdus sp.]|uniref:2-hydroxyacid dehydrogenase n=1 Tax=Aquirhabdus sp. TaxID=2824160 RepID=UPI00396CD189